MSEFVELGGYIVSGETLVYPDNTTMTGDGTVENPFGVKSTDLYVQSPLFIGTSGTSAYIGWNNETLLWSGTLASGSTATLSESITAFEKIGFAGYCHNGNGYTVYGEAPVISNVVRIAATTFWPGSPEFDMVKCECTDSTVKSWGTSILYNGSTLDNGGTITKVVGINRKV